MLLQSSTAETRMSSLYLTSNIWSFGKFKSIAFPAVESKVDILFPRNSEKIFYHIFISFLFHRERLTKYFISFLVHPDQMTKYFTTFLFHSYFTGNEWRNILSHFYLTKYFISFLFHPSGSNDEIFYHIFISFLVHPERMTKYFIS